MTGQGGGRTQVGLAEVSAELRSVNNRHLKIQTRVSESLAGLEPQLETLVRQNVSRGSIQLNVQVIGGQPATSYTLQTSVIKSYWEQTKRLSNDLDVSQSIQLVDLLMLPGSVQEIRATSTLTEIDTELASAAEGAVLAALESLNQMRAREGLSMRDELHRQLVRLAQLCDEIEIRSPIVLEEYSTRLATRLQAAMATVEEGSPSLDLTREIALLADKLDIREELVRIRSHFDQFDKLLDSGDPEGRKLDFLIQEMFREANTIGSKANDATIAQRVVDIKTAIEQMRELVQNVE